jgi:hypothetical protein
MPQITKVCASCNEPFNATCGAAVYCSDRCHILGSRIAVGDCWLWAAGKDKDGYGVVRFKGRRRVKAHRAAHEIFKGPIGEGQMVCHACDTPSCVNPDHLFLGSAKSNKADCVAKGRHVRGESAPKAKLTPDQVRAIRSQALVADGPALATQYGVTKEAIYAIWNRKSWRHI